MPLFDADRPLRVAALFSGGASGVRHLLECDPNCGEAYEVVCGFTSDPDCAGVELLGEAGIPVETNDIEAFYAARGAERRDLDVRRAFDTETRERIAPYEPDLVLLSGYMWILTEAVVDAYPVINVHPADLTIEDAAGERVYAGFDPVADAVLGGEPETRSSVHFVTADVDAGPLLVLSRPFPVHTELVSDLAAHDANGAIEAYVTAHQEWMKWEGDGPAIAAALELVAAGRVERDGATATIDGEPGHIDLGESA